MHVDKPICIYYYKCRDWEMPITFLYVCTGDNHWNSQKLCTEKSTVGNEPCIKEVTASGGFFVFYG